MRHASLILCALAAGCAPRTALRSEAPEPATFTPDIPVTRPPYDAVHADWKERLAQPYVYVEHVGSYTETGRLLPGLFAALAGADLEPSGPPFGLYYDDPGAVAIDRLRSRACFPVSAPPPVQAGIASDVLPAATVAYALVAGPYPEVPRAQAGLFAFVRRMGWTADGPVREIYLTPPEAVASHADLLAEIQVPVASLR